MFFTAYQYGHHHYVPSVVNRSAVMDSIHDSLQYVHGGGPIPYTYTTPVWYMSQTITKKTINFVTQQLYVTNVHDLLHTTSVSHFNTFEAHYQLHSRAEHHISLPHQEEW